MTVSFDSSHRREFFKLKFLAIHETRYILIGE